MNIVHVAGKKEQKNFLKVAKLLYKDDPVWVCPMDKQINAIFDPKQNTYYSHGTAERWVLKDDSGQLIGRIAAFIDYKNSKAEDQPTGGVGFFECINNQQAADLLFDKAKEWLTEHKQEAMDGPINFGERDSWWGLLIDGFTHPSYEIAYNPPYYQALFENYGFQTYFKQEGFHLDVTQQMDERFLRIGERVRKNPGYEFKHFTWKEEDKYSRDFAEVFNIAWESFMENFEPLKVEYIKNTLKKAKVILEEEFIWLAYKDDKPIAIYLMLPDVNMILKHLDGRMHLFNMLKFLYLKKRKAMSRARGILMGVIPEFQNRGIESVFIMEVEKVIRRKPHYKEIEFSWVGDFNPKMRKIFIAAGCKSVKHYITYRYLFDRTKPFKRFPIPE
jgi:GNAT superfamily N-acetyltransferase